MDRNLALRRVLGGALVASREGGVDRNFSVGFSGVFGFSVASREGGVDRNFARTANTGVVTSPPARGAWIATL